MTLRCIYILKTYIYFRTKCDLKRGSDIHSYRPINRVGDNFCTGRAVVHFITTLPIRQISFILTANVQTWLIIPQFPSHLKLVRNLEWSLKSFQYKRVRVHNSDSLLTDWYEAGLGKFGITGCNGNSSDFKNVMFECNFYVLNESKFLPLFICYWRLR